MFYFPLPVYVCFLSGSLCSCVSRLFPGSLFLSCFTPVFMLFPVCTFCLPFVLDFEFWNGLYPTTALVALKPVFCSVTCPTLNSVHLGQALQSLDNDMVCDVFIMHVSIVMMMKIQYKGSKHSKDGLHSSECFTVNREKMQRKVISLSHSSAPHSHFERPRFGYSIGSPTYTHKNSKESATEKRT